MTSHKLAAGLAVGLIIASGLHAQAVSNPDTTTADSPPPTGEVIQLDPFTVSTEGADGYISKSTVAFGRVAMKLENVPQKIEIYNAQFIADIIPTTISDITRYSTAVDYNNSERNDGSSMVRGFVASTRRNGENLGDLVGLAAVETIEQTEVVKGPSAVLYGASQPGGVINYVTKMPRFTPEYNATLQLHSLGGYTGMVDLTGPLGDPKRKGGPIAAYRLVVVDEDRDEYQDNSDFFKRQVFFGKLLFRPAPWLSLTLEAERSELSAAFFNSQLPLQSDYNASRAAPYTTSVPNPALVREPFFLPIGWTYQTEDTYRLDRAELYQATITMNKDFGRYGHWTLRSFYSLNNGADIDRDLVDVPNTSYPQSVTVADIGKVVNRDQTVTAADVTAGRLWIPRRSRRLLNSRTDETARNQLDLTGQFDTGPVAHTLLLGTELNLGNKTRFSSPFSNGNPGGTNRFAFEGAAGAAYATWIDNVDYRPIPVAWDNVISPTNPTGTVRLQALAPGVVRDDISFEIPYLTEKPTAFYIFDALSLMKDRLHVSIGLRHDEISQQYRDTANVIQTANSEQWTKRFGVVFKLRDWLHVYGIYNESFSPNPAGALNAWRQPLAPQDGKQKEVGVRLNFLEDRLSVDASYFDITNSNVYQNDPFGKLPTRFPPGTDLGTIPDTVLWPNTPGLQNRGFDLQATFRLSSSTQVLASYTRNDMVATGTVTQQLALGSPTYKVNNVPDDHFSLWSKWTPKEGRLKGFSFNLGYRYVGDRPGGPVGNVAQISLGSYSMVDAAVGYTYKKWRVNLTIRNVLDEYAFRTASGADRLYPEKPVHAVLSISTKF